MTPLDEALRLDRWGLNTLPAAYGGKAPIVAWQPFQSERTTDKLKHWFRSKPLNYWVATGVVSHCLVLDVDSLLAEEYWQNLIGELLGTTTCARTAKGHHYFFRVEDGDYIASWSHHDADTGLQWDVRAEGTGVIVPPSVHASGHQYEWVRDPDSMLLVPEVLRGPQKATTEATGASTRSMLSELLGKPAEAGGRNNWLARVAGHYAKHFRDMRDAYDVHCTQANARLRPPLADDEFQKTIDSVWSKEHRKAEAQIIEPTEDSGWLIAGDRVLLTEVVRGKGAKRELVLEPWSDFDIRAMGVVEDADTRRVYDVMVRRHRQSDDRPGVLAASVLADSRRLAAWLAEFGVTVMPPGGEFRKGSVCSRLSRYVEEQKPPHFQVVEHLGWHGDGFVCHEGVIRADGMHGHATHKPDPRLRNWAPYRYGISEEKLARKVLRQVLTFHDETVCAVFGAWWAACILKPQVMKLASQFPFMALEAPSESGKTTGFFSLMLQLNGNTQGQVDPTRAALRDYLSAHQSGIVWIDDLSDMKHLMDLLRQSTVEGSVAKKGEDNSEQTVAQLVAPVVISGETLPLHNQKALLDRAVMLEVPSPTQRRSLHHDRPQWDDVLELRERFPDLTIFAGSYVRQALEMVSLLEDLPGLRPAVGRWADKMATLRMGARLLERLAGGQGEYIARVDAWVDLQMPSDENTLTLKLLPLALAQTNWQPHPMPAEGRWPATSTFIKEGIVWFSPRSLALWWSEMQHGRIELRTESEEALVQQARVVTIAPCRRRFDLGHDRNQKAMYWRLDEVLSEQVLARSRDITPSSPRVSQGSRDNRDILPEEHTREGDPDGRLDI